MYSIPRGHRVGAEQRAPAMLAIRLPEEIEQRLDALARKTGRTKSYYVREAIVEHLADLEDYYLAERRTRTRAKGVPIADVERRLGLDD